MAVDYVCFTILLLLVLKTVGKETLNYYLLSEKTEKRLRP